MLFWLFLLVFSFFRHCAWKLKLCTRKVILKLPLFTTIEETNWGQSFRNSVLAFRNLRRLSTTALEVSTLWWYYYLKDFMSYIINLIYWNHFCGMFVMYAKFHAWITCLDTYKFMGWFSFSCPGDLFLFTFFLVSLAPDAVNLEASGDLSFFFKQEEVNKITMNFHIYLQGVKDINNKPKIEVYIQPHINMQMYAYIHLCMNTHSCTSNETKFRNSHQTEILFLCEKTRLDYDASLHLAVLYDCQP